MMHNTMVILAVLFAVLLRCWTIKQLIECSACLLHTTGHHTVSAHASGNEQLKYSQVHTPKKRIVPQVLLTFAHVTYNSQT